MLNRSGDLLVALDDERPRAAKPMSSKLSAAVESTKRAIEKSAVGSSPAKVNVTVKGSDKRN